MDNVFKDVEHAWQEAGMPSRDVSDVPERQNIHERTEG
jgi:hypothetical protein